MDGVFSNVCSDTYGMCRTSEVQTLRDHITVVQYGGFALQEDERKGDGVRKRDDSFSFGTGHKLAEHQGRIV